MAAKKKVEDIPGTKAHQIYRLKDGTRVPGGSTIAKIAGAHEGQRFLVRWANRLGLEGYDSEKYVDKLADVGTLTHAMALTTMYNQREKFPELFDLFPKWVVDKANICFAKFDDWAKDKEFDPDFNVCERPFVSERHRFGGTCDFFGGLKWQGEWRRALLDWKTSKYVYREHLYQVSGYAALLAENGYSAERIGILRMGRDEEEGFQFIHRTPEELEVQWQIFHTSIQLYYLQKQEPKYIN